MVGLKPAIPLATLRRRNTGLKPPPKDPASVTSISCDSCDRIITFVYFRTTESPFLDICLPCYVLYDASLDGISIPGGTRLKKPGDKLYFMGNAPRPEIRIGEKCGPAPIDDDEVQGKGTGKKLITKVQRSEDADSEQPPAMKSSRKRTRSPSRDRQGRPPEKVEHHRTGLAELFSGLACGLRKATVLETPSEHPVTVYINGKSLPPGQADTAGPNTIAFRSSATGPLCRTVARPFVSFSGEKHVSLMVTDQRGQHVSFDVWSLGPRLPSLKFSTCAGCEKILDYTWFPAALPGVSAFGLTTMIRQSGKEVSLVTVLLPREQESLERHVPDVCGIYPLRRVGNEGIPSRLEWLPSEHAPLSSLVVVSTCGSALVLSIDRTRVGQPNMQLLPTHRIQRGCPRGIALTVHVAVGNFCDNICLGVATGSKLLVYAGQSFGIFRAFELASDVSCVTFDSNTIKVGFNSGELFSIDSAGAELAIFTDKGSTVDGLTSGRNETLVLAGGRLTSQPSGKLIQTFRCQSRDDQFDIGLGDREGEPTIGFTVALVVVAPGRVLVVSDIGVAFLVDV